MAQHKNAIIRYNTIDQCLGRSDREWTKEDLIKECNRVLEKGDRATVGIRTIETDIQMLKNEFGAPIVVYNRKYYKYKSEFSINSFKLNENHLNVLSEAFFILQQFKNFEIFRGVEDIIQRLEDKIYAKKSHTSPVIHFDKNDQVRGLNFLEDIYKSIINKKTFIVRYNSFNSKTEQVIRFKPFILKEYTNRWFVVGKKIVERNDRIVSEDTITNLAIDRITSIEYCPEVFNVNEAFNPDEYYKNVVGVTVMNKKEPEVIRLWIAKENAPYVMTKPIHLSQDLIHSNDDGSIIVEVTLIENPELDRILLGFGRGLEVICPERLRSRIQKNLNEAASKYNKEVPIP